MSKLSLIDKLGLFFEVATKSYWSILILIVILIIGFIFTSTNRNNIKRNKRIYIIFSISILLLLFICYFNSIGKIFDNMINNLFIIIYFPNLAIYFAAIIATSIILWISIFNFKTSDIIKKLNLVIYLIINYIFALLLFLIKDQKLDIFNQEAIYSNKQALALIELTSIIFIVWIIFLIIYKLILIYLRKDYKPKVKVKKVLVEKKVKKLPENYLSIDVPNIVYRDKPIVVKPTIEEKDYIEIEVPKVVYKTNTKPKEDKVIKYYEDMLSLEDYKLLLKLLLKEKKKEKEIKKEKEEVQPNFTELENLFRSIR